MEEAKKEAKELFEAAQVAAIRNMPYDDNGTYNIVEKTKKLCATYIKEQEDKSRNMSSLLRNSCAIFPIGYGFWWDVKQELINNYFN